MIIASVWCFRKITYFILQNKEQHDIFIYAFVLNQSIWWHKFSYMENLMEMVLLDKFLFKHANGLEMQPNNSNKSTNMVLKR